MIRVCPRCGAKNRVPPARLHKRPKCGKCGEPLVFDAPVDVGEGEFDAIISEASIPVLVDFWAPWCGPCRAVAPELAKLAKEKAGQVLVVKVNTDQAPRVARRFEITGIPALLLFRNGQVADRVSGAMPAAAIAQRFRL